ncbi:hypothetical protein HPB47_021729 [Ixodes persulcatus]|uniref:Uncharacterized protein n=1 Tax=Ixodes persulcatus TaxID=34615 RepID=A0AC60QBP7_IXOPE|nr:hypothetical protein HPB47_021729 [Ixodes persulcatus]
MDSDLPTVNPPEPTRLDSRRELLDTPRGLVPSLSYNHQSGYNSNTGFSASDAKNFGAGQQQGSSGFSGGAAAGQAGYGQSGFGKVAAGGVGVGGLGYGIH